MIIYFGLEEDLTEEEAQKFIEDYGETIIQYLSNDIDPAQICTEIHLCKAQTKDNDAIKNLNLSRCEVCMLVSDYLSTVVNDTYVYTEINEYAEKTCALIPKSYRQDCNAMIEDYGPYLLNLLAEETDKGKICAQIQLCPAVSTGADINENTIEEFEY